MILRAGDFDRRGELGGKAAALAELVRAGLPVPEWFALPPTAFREGRLTDDARFALSAALDELCPDSAPVAVRSSAADEDGSVHSFAGQLDSFLFVPLTCVIERAQDVVASALGDRHIEYRRRANLPLPGPTPAVIVQRMVEARAAGVAFSADPVSGRRGVAVVSAAPGLGSAVVGGEVEADTFHVDRDRRITSRLIAVKTIRHARDSQQGVRAEPIEPHLATAPSLTDAEAIAIAELSRRCERVFGSPQDIEWAIDAGGLRLLQSRPITGLDLPDPDGVEQLWDNSNIAESYGGVTAALTFSFARRAYEEVYRQFCRIMRVSPAVISENAGLFRNMIGHIRGRVFYNLLNWYRMLAMLPGFGSNKAFMEQMMGVRQGLPAAVVESLNRPRSLGRRIVDNFRTLGTVFGLVWNHIRLGRTVRAFRKRLDDALSPRPLERMRPDELVAHYRELESQLLVRWDAPLVNDFFAMIHFGLLRKLCGKWLGDGNAMLFNDLLCGQTGIISTEPARLQRELADIAAGEPEFVTRLCEGSLDEIRRAMPRRFADNFAEYLELFGERCLEELKLETPTHVDDPLPLLRSIGRAAGARPAGGNEHAIRTLAEHKVSAHLRLRPLRRMLLAWVLRNARARVRDRENLRFERTRVFGRARRIFVELGRRLQAAGKLDAPTDVFHLEVDEVLGFVEGTATCTDLRGLSAVRKAECESFRHCEPPDDRFVTHGAVNLGNRFQGKSVGGTNIPVCPTSTWTGLGACPGIVRAYVCVVLDPRRAAPPPGCILVAERTDPGWIGLFAIASGLVVERGSLLSHAAIVAREMGLPAVVSVPGITKRLRDGDIVELDGSAGTVTLVRSIADR